VSGGSRELKIGGCEAVGGGFGSRGKNQTCLGGVDGLSWSESFFGLVSNSNGGTTAMFHLVLYSLDFLLSEQEIPFADAPEMLV
jgi:hypothetical protein